MSRSNYSDDFGDDYPGQMNLYRANVDRSMRSKAGQTRLRELREALLAMPVKALEPEIFVEPPHEWQNQPRVCALGQWALLKCGGDATAAHNLVPRDADDQETANVLKAHGWPKLVVWETVFQNDEGTWKNETPEQRYDRMLAWVTSQIVEAA